MRNRLGYTLTELLVCIAIIALTGAIVFSAFAPVRERASETRCVSNMHQIYLALQMYRSDCGGEDPPAARTAAEIGLPNRVAAFIHKGHLENVFKCGSAYYNQPENQWPLSHYNIFFAQYENPSSPSLPKFSDIVAKHGMDTILFVDIHHGDFLNKVNNDPLSKVLILRLSGKAEFKRVSSYTPSWDW